MASKYNIRSGIGSYSGQDAKNRVNNYKTKLRTSVHFNNQTSATGQFVTNQSNK
jgi:hypothetical protein